MTIAQEISDLLLRLRLGEDSSLQFKTADFDGNKVRNLNPDSVADEIAAFANSRGGDILFGINDKTNDVVGIPIDKLDLLDQWVSNLAENNIEPAHTIYTRRLELPDRSGQQHAVLKVEVPRSLFVHKTRNGYFKRQGSTKRELGSRELARLFQIRGRAGYVSFDEYPVPACAFPQLDGPLWRRFTGEGPDSSELKLRKLKLLAKDEDGEEFAAVAAVLMCTPRATEWIRSAYVQCVAYSGVQRNADQQLDARDYEGPLDQQITEGTEFVRRNMRVAARKFFGREDFPQFHIQSVFEGIANAVAHRDYSQPGTPVQVHQFADRLEILTPGALPNSQTVESLPYFTATRNELIAGLLGRCPIDIPDVARRRIVEKRGEGVPLLLAASEELSHRRPLYEMIGENALRLTLYAAEPPDSDDFREDTLRRLDNASGGT